MCWSGNLDIVYLVLWNTQYTGHSFVWNTHSQCTGSYLSVEHSVHWSQFCVEHSQSLYWFLPICGTLSTLVTVLCGTLTVSVLVPTYLWNTQYSGHSCVWNTHSQCTGSYLSVEHSVHWFRVLCGTLSVLVPTYLWNTQYTGSEFCVEHSQSVYWFLPICGTLSTLVQSFVWNTHSQFTGSYLSVEHWFSV